MINEKTKDNKNTYKAKVSVIIPCYNSASHIRECVESILSNTYHNIEVICIDDGSTDKTLDILDIIKSRDDRLKVIKQKHKGVSAARNAGLEAAKGKYISFVDSDDFIQNNAYEILVEVAEDHSLDLIIFGGNTIGKAPEWVLEKLNTSYRHYRKGETQGIIFREKSATPFIWLHFIKRSLLEAPQKIRFNEKMDIGEDAFLQFQYVPKAESVMVIEDKLYNYRINDSDSIMQRYYNRRYEKLNSHMTLVSNVIDAWKKKGWFDNNKDHVFMWAINLFYYHIIQFPIPFQPEPCRRVLDLIYKYDPDFSSYYLNAQERENYRYLVNMSSKEYDISKELSELLDKIKGEEREISETLKSKAFKLGRKLTPKKKRLDLKGYGEYLDKR